MKRKFFIFYLLCSLLLLAEAEATKPKNFESDLYQKTGIHPIHVSFTTIEYFEKEQKFRLLFKIFVDDFDLVLKHKYGKDLKLIEGRWEKNYLKVVNRYILEHFKLIVDGKDKTKSLLKFTKKQIKEQAIWLYYDFDIRVKSDSFNIYNSLMTDLYQDQNNLVIFAYKGEQKALKFNLKSKEQELKF